MDEWLTEYGVTLGVGALILYIGLAMGIFGFLIKVIITYLLENAGG